MSAYLVDNEHIAQIIEWCKLPGHHMNSYNIYTKERLPDTYLEKAICLLEGNIDSIKARYEDALGYKEDDFQSFRKDLVNRILNKKNTDFSLTPNDIWNMCNCLEYQSCEVSNWIETDAYWLIQHIKGIAGDRMAKSAKQRWDYKPNAKPVVDYDDYGMLVQ